MSPSYMTIFVKGPFHLKYQELFKALQHFTAGLKERRSIEIIEKVFLFKTKKGMYIKYGGSGWKFRSYFPQNLMILHPGHLAILDLK